MRLGKKAGIIGALVGVGIGGFFLIRSVRFPVDRGPGNKGKCGEIRSALSIYYSDNQGQYPSTLDALVPKYLNEIPELSGVGTHAPSRFVRVTTAPALTDSGGWAYVFSPGSAAHGHVWIDCIHREGATSWSAF